MFWLGIFSVTIQRSMFECSPGISVNVTDFSLNGPPETMLSLTDWDNKEN